jgi:hypothetical protein
VILDAFDFSAGPSRGLQPPPACPSTVTKYGESREFFACIALESSDIGNSRLPLIVSRTPLVQDTPVKTLKDANFKRASITTNKGYLALKAAVSANHTKWKPFNRDFMDPVLAQLDDTWKLFDKSETADAKAKPSEQKQMKLQLHKELDELERLCVKGLQALKGFPADIKNASPTNPIYDWADRFLTFLKAAANKEYQELARVLGKWNSVVSYYEYPGLKSRK